MAKTASFALAMMFATGAIAQPREPESPVRTEQVSYSDLDLAGGTAQAVLQSRIRAAADRVCQSGEVMDEFADWSKCYRSAVKDGVRQMRQVLANNRPTAGVAAAALMIPSR